MARKGLYEDWLTEEKLILLEGWARDGLTDEQIAKNMGIGARTLYEWKNKFPQISQTLKKGKEIIDREVENALLKSALGYEYEEVTDEAEEVRDQNNKPVGTRKVHRKVVKKYMPPNTAALIFWLKNRKPSVWKDKTDEEYNPESLKKARELLGGVDSVID